MYFQLRVQNEPGKLMHFSAVICVVSQLQFAEVSEKVMDLAVLAHMANIMHQCQAPAEELIPTGAALSSAQIRFINICFHSARNRYILVMSE